MNDMDPGAYVDATSLFDLRDKVAIVTGAAQGLGQAIAEGLASVGTLVVLADAKAEGLRETTQAITTHDGCCTSVVVDLRVPEQRAHLVEQAIATFHQVDILINCAGVSRGAPSEDYPDDFWDLTLAVNLTAAFHLSKLVARHMIPRRTGVIINVSSIGGLQGFPRNPAYQASKGGLLALTRAMATDWAEHGIRVNCICPGYFRTTLNEKSYGDPGARTARSERNMLNRWGEPHEVVGPVIFLASQAASYITGSDLRVDGGWTSAGLTAAQA